MIAFQGGYLNATDTAEVAFVRSTDHVQRGLIIEELDSQAVP